jgi:hypothetical protein
MKEPHSQGLEKTVPPFQQEVKENCVRILSLVLWADSIMGTESKRTKWFGHAARIGEIENSNKILAG